MRTANLSSIIEVLDALEGTGTGAWGWDVGTNTVRWSQNTAPLYGLPRGHQPATYEEFLTLVHPEDRRMVADAVEKALSEARDYDIDFRVTWPDGTLHWLNARAHAITDDDGTTSRIVGVVSDATERVRAGEQTRFLAKAGEMLGASLHVENTLSHVAELLVDQLADWCSVMMLDQGKLRTAIIAHRDPAKMDLVARLQQEYPPDPEPSGIAREAIETGRPILLESIPDEMLVEAAVDDHHLEILRSLGLLSALTVPLTARGEVLALMSLVSAESGHRFTPNDVAFAEEFARRAALALDNARLHQETLRAREEAERSTAQLQALNNVVSRLSGAADVSSVATAAIEEGVAALGADRGAVVVRSDEKPAIVASVGYPEERLAAFRSAIGEPGPLYDAMEHGESVFLASTRELIDRYPNLGPVMKDAAESAFIAVPLRSVNGTIGAIGFVYRGSRTLGPGEEALASAVADHVALAIERSMLFERNRSVAEALSAALAPPPVVEDGAIPAAARYRAAGVGDIGGDWYDVVTSPHGTQIYIIGDVVGRGLAAVATMAQLRQSLRMLLLEGHDPADALGKLSAVASIETMALCSTVCCAEIDADSRAVRLTSAGHLPPVVVGPDRAELVDLPVGPPLGVGAGPPSRSITLGPDECLVMFTDGVIERRDRHIDDSLRHVCTVLATTPPIVDVIADTLLDHAQHADDDATILAIGGSRGHSGR